MNLFTYGTLMHPLVWEKIGNANCTQIPASLRHYSVRRLKGVQYPGLITDLNGQAEGILYFNLNATELQRLDQFEGTEYQRIAVDVHGNNELIQAYTYLYTGDRNRITADPWKLEDFKLHESFLIRNQ